MMLPFSRAFVFNNGTMWYTNKDSRLDLIILIKYTGLFRSIPGALEGCLYYMTFSCKPHLVNLILNNKSYVTLA